MVNLKHFRKAKGLTQLQIAEALGADQSWVSRAERMKSLLTGEQWKKLHDAFGMVENGRFLSQVEEAPIGYTYGELLFIPQAAEAGFLAGEVSAISNSDLVPYQGIPTFNQPGYAFVVSGESMLDTLRPGEVIVTGRDHVKHISEIKSGYIYVLDTDDAILVKRVNRHSEDDKLWLESDNEDYDEIEISFENIRRMWRARRIIGYNLNKKMRYE